MDAKTLQACTNAKAMPNNVTIYTVGLSVSSDPIDAAGLDLLKKCASSPTMAYVANDLLRDHQRVRGDRPEHRRPAPDPIGAAGPRGAKSGKRSDRAQARPVSRGSGAWHNLCGDLS
jgi:hypothetical protein